jgi:hypothetical protein
MKRAPTPRLSVLIPTITERESEANALYRSLELRVAGRDVEILMMRENLLCGIGEARNKLLRAAGGKYVTFLDDDDALLDGFFTLVLAATEEDADVITYDQHAVVDGAEGRITCRLGAELQAFRPGGVATRPPWFWCAWRRELGLRLCRAASSSQRGCALACGIFGPRPRRRRTLIKCCTAISSTRPRPPCRNLTHNGA